MVDFYHLEITQTDSNIALFVLGDEIVLCVEMLGMVISKALNWSAVTRQYTGYLFYEILLITLLNFHHTDREIIFPSLAFNLQLYFHSVLLLLKCINISCSKGRFEGFAAKSACSNA